MALRDIEVSKKVWVPSGLVAIGLMAIVWLALDLLHDVMMEDRQDKVRNIIESTIGVADAFEARAKAGEMTLEEAAEQAKNTIRTMRYDEVEYVFIIDSRGEMVMHPIKPSLDGKNVYGVKDKNDVPLFENMIKTVQSQGAGFVPYLWPKAGEEKPVEKISYVKGYQPFDWILGTGIYIDDVQSLYLGNLTRFVVIALVFMAVAGIIGFFIIRDIVRPLTRMTQSMSVLAQGNLAVDVVGGERGDELGAMARAVEVFKTNARERKALEEKQAQAERQAVEDRRRTMLGMADNFENAVGEVVSHVSTTSEEMYETAGNLAGSADHTSSRMTNIAAASEQASQNVQTVAASAEQLSASITEISSQVTRSVEIAGNAVGEAQRSTEMVHSLSESADRIGEVVTLINDIAEQTNLLALNATIEAARAGDMGKGFAVVASEVKNLANQTAKATDEIGSLIQGIQGETRGAVHAIEGISSTIGEVSEIATAIASAVEEQGAATQEITGSIQRVADGTSSMNGDIADVNQTAKQTETTSNAMRSATERLSNDAQDLQNQVATFLAEVRSA